MKHLKIFENTNVKCTFCGKIFDLLSLSCPKCGKPVTQKSLIKK